MPEAGPQIQKIPVEMEGGKWIIAIKGREVCIIDPQGRCRHQSVGHHMTAIHLAMNIAKYPFASTPNADEALQLIAKRFLEED